MPKKSKLKLPHLNLGEETFGQRLARLRKEKGYTQVELAKKTGLLQTLITDYERDRLRPYHEMIVRFALALHVSADELLGLKSSKGNGKRPVLKIQRRLKKIEELSPSQQKFILKTLDTLLNAYDQ
jgi:transcriptional regulator with XRE-family HTH domain